MRVSSQRDPKGKPSDAGRKDRHQVAVRQEETRSPRPRKRIHRGSLSTKRGRMWSHGKYMISGCVGSQTAGLPNIRWAHTSSQAAAPQGKMHDPPLLRQGTVELPNARSAYRDPRGVANCSPAA
ncbi:hypothetical protein FKM82_017328 [Ascaphus truei]